MLTPYLIFLRYEYVVVFIHQTKKEYPSLNRLSQVMALKEKGYSNGRLRQEYESVKEY